MVENEGVMLECVRCNLCGAGDTAPLMDIDGFHIVRCRRCGLVYVNPRFQQEALHEIYTEAYYEHDGIDNGLEFYGYEGYLEDRENIKITFAKRLRTIERFASRGRLLDVGCATGFFLALARDQGWEAIGTEVSSFAAEYAREELGLTVHTGTLRQLQLESGSFDVVTMWDVIEHLLDPTAELKEAGRLLRPGGVLSIITPDIDSSVARLLGPRWEEVRRVREHVYFFSERTLREMLAGVGFRVLKRESASKVFFLGPAVRRLKYYVGDGVLPGLATRIVYGLHLDRIRVNINPFTKIAIYAQKKA